jgi:MazG family protein
LSDRFSEAGEKFAELVRIMARLRQPGGCPWDAEQTPQTLKSYLLEETYEVLDAIDREDWPGLVEELGDLLLQPVFLAELGSNLGIFTIADSLDAINGKLVRRHPHVFGDATAETAEEVTARWDEIKKREKAAAEPISVLDAVPRNLPALVEAEKIGKKAAQLGFEWSGIDGVVEKLQEEAAELAQARQTGDPAEIENEVGDLLFTIVNLARWLKIDPEQALRKTNARFRHRFAFIEKEIAAGDRGKMPLARMEELWQEAKRRLSENQNTI